MNIVCKLLGHNGRISTNVLDEQQITLLCWRCHKILWERGGHRQLTEAEVFRALDNMNRV